MSLAADFVLTRFATKSYGFMRTADEALIPWLKLHKIKFTAKGRRVFFELPDELKRFTKITEDLCKELAIARTEIKQCMHHLSYTFMKKIRDPLSFEELALIIEHDLPLYYL